MLADTRGRADAAYGHWGKDVLYGAVLESPNEADSLDSFLTPVAG